MRPWSHSRLSNYETCPKQYFYAYVEKRPSHRPPSPAAERGSAIHAKAEQYLLGKLHIYPPELQKVAAHAMKLKVANAGAEKKLAVTDKWEPCDYDAPEVYIRGIIDVLYTDEDGHVHVQDWKTGQQYSTHAGQLENYVAIVAAHHPEAKSYQTRLIYIDQGIVTSARLVPPERVKPIRLLLDGRIKNAEEDKQYPTRAGQSCRYCNYSKRFGGPCAY
jgi:CRISPR/Cas system-associated exonuclease Cas4 (RecB family)